MFAVAVFCSVFAVQVMLFILVLVEWVPFLRVILLLLVVFRVSEEKSSFMCAPCDNK